MVLLRESRIARGLSAKRTAVDLLHHLSALDEDSRVRYEEAVHQVRPHVMALRAAFAFQQPDRPAFERDLLQGTLDSRKLVVAAIGISRQIYKRRVVHPATGMAVCLLLDESGSMSGIKATTTLQVAALFAESLRGIPGIELEIFSHTSSAENDADCMIRHLAGKQMRDHRTIGSYAAGHMGNTYDHQAIHTVAKLFRRTTKSRHRWMIVISDGQPSGNRYGGAPAINATRDVVTSVRRQGIKVIIKS